jgi:hypothetical protein
MGGNGQSKERSAPISGREISSIEEQDLLRL